MEKYNEGGHAKVDAKKDERESKERKSVDITKAKKWLEEEMEAKAKAEKQRQRAENLKYRRPTFEEWEDMKDDNPEGHPHSKDAQLDVLDCEYQINHHISALLQQLMIYTT